MVRFVCGLAALSLVGCHLVLELDPPPHDSGEPVDGPVLEEGPPVPDGPGDGPSQLTVTFGVLMDQQLPIGGHVVVSMTADSPSVPTPFRLTAMPCRLKLKGSGGAVVPELQVPVGELPALVVFAPPDADPAAKCAVSSPDDHVILVQSPIVDLGPPVYVSLPEVGTNAKVLKGLELVGTVEIGGYRPQALTWAGGAFGGAWFVGTGFDEGVPKSAESTVRVRSVSVDATKDEIWINLVGKKKEPYHINDLVWAPRGPCPTGDALYLGVNLQAEPTYSIEEHGLFCIDAATRQVVPHSSYHRKRVRALDVDVDGNFEGITGALYISRWGGHARFPGDVSLDPATYHLPVISSWPMRMYRGGAFAGHIVALGHDNGSFPEELVRISPKPHQRTVLADESAFGTIVWLALSPGGHFGDIPLVAHSTGNKDLTDLTAVFVDNTQQRKLDLARKVQCGRMATFDEDGNRLALISKDTVDCSGGKYFVAVMEFKLP